MIATERRVRPGRVLVGVVTAAVAAVAMFVLVGRVAGFTRVRHALDGARFEWLIVCIVGQVLVFAGYAGSFRAAVAAEGGPHVDVATSVRVVLASFAATQLFGFAGVGGPALMYVALRRYERNRHAATIRLIGLNTAVYLVFAAIGWCVAVIALALGLAPLAMTAPWVVGVPAVVLLARWFTADERVSRWTAHDGGSLRAALGTGVGAAAWVRHRIGDRTSRPLFAWAACYWLADIASLWGALSAFGAAPGVVPLASAYTAGYLVQSAPIPFIATAGVDTATTLLLHSVDVPLDVALLGILAHRVFAFWVPVLPGSLFALTLSRLRPQPAER